MSHGLVPRNDLSCPWSPSLGPFQPTPAPIPRRPELHLILFLITGGSLREHPVLGSQEIEHVKGALPAGGGKNGGRLVAIPLRCYPPTLGLGLLLAEQEKYHYY